VSLRYQTAPLVSMPSATTAIPPSVAGILNPRQAGCKTGLATMSRCEQARRVLEVLDLAHAFDFIAALDDVEQGKPDPEIYQLVARELDVPPAEGLVIEDSPSGVKAALGAGMWCIVVTTPFTRRTIHAARLLDERWVVDDPATLTDAVQHMFAEHGQD
jgi:beta-phosphoglucomutase-like phosphatase (HAD superfamily)